MWHRDITLSPALKIVGKICKMYALTKLSVITFYCSNITNILKYNEHLFLQSYKYKKLFRFRNCFIFFSTGEATSEIIFPTFGKAPIHLYYTILSIENVFLQLNAEKLWESSIALSLSYALLNYRTNIAYEFVVHNVDYCAISQIIIPFRASDFLATTHGCTWCIAILAQNIWYRRYLLSNISHNNLFVIVCECLLRFGNT